MKINRRDFIKNSVLVTAALVSAFHAPTVMHKLLSAPRRSDPESQWCYWMIDNLSANETIFCIKQHGFHITKGKMSDWFLGFSNRQPEVLAWLRARVALRNPDFSEDSRLFHAMKMRPRAPGREWYKSVAKKHEYAMNRFGFGVPAGFRMGMARYIYDVFDQT
jgi:hypothetical protein